MDGNRRRARRLERADRPRAGPADHVGRAVRRVPRAPRVAGRPAPDPRDRPRRPRGGARRRPRTAQRRLRAQRAVGHVGAATDTPVAHDARPRARRRHHDRRRRRRQADTDAQRRSRRPTSQSGCGPPRPTASRCRSTSSATSTHQSTARAPCCVYGYGSYEASMPPWFSVARLSWLDRGGTWALVHPRGGGELGRAWYLDGKLLAKRNTFTDTLAACDHLVSIGVADRDRVAIRGGSAGGLLVGACVTIAPDQFKAAVAEVPFVDVVTTMSDPSLPLTVTEWEEWGDPRREPFASYMLELLAVRQHAGGRLPGAVRHGRAQRPTCELPRAGQVDRQAARRAHQSGALRCCCGPRWAPATPARAVATTPGATRPACCRSCCARCRSQQAPARPSTSSAALRARCSGPIGFADHAPKHAHGGRLPSDRRLAISAENSSSRKIATNCGIGLAT